MIWHGEKSELTKYMQTIFFIKYLEKVYKRLKYTFGS